MDKISIIIPIYNEENYLRQAMNSVLNQTYPNLEIICINDGSTDSSLNILEWYASLDPRIKIINKKNKGIGAARNTGLDAVTGEYVMFLDSDDIFESGAVEQAYNCIVSKNADIVVFNSNYINEAGFIQKKTDMKFFEKYNDRKITMDVLGDIGNIYVTDTVWNKIFRYQFIQENNIRFPQGQNVGEDNLFCIFCILNKANIYTLPKTLHNYRFSRNTSASHIQKNKCSILLNSFNYFVECEQFQKAPEKFKIRLIDMYLERIFNDYIHTLEKYYKFIAVINNAGKMRYLKHFVGIDLLSQCSYYLKTSGISIYKFPITKKIKLRKGYRTKTKRKKISLCG